MENKAIPKFFSQVTSTAANEITATLPVINGISNSIDQVGPATSLKRIFVWPIALQFGGQIFNESREENIRL
jgi:hypothetical protein